MEDITHPRMQAPEMAEAQDKAMVSTIEDGIEAALASVLLVDDQIIKSTHSHEVRARGGKTLMSSTGVAKEKVDEDKNSISLNPALVVAASESDSETTCKICFDSEQMTCNFVTLEGCGHQFCAKCVKKHAEARVDGGQMNVTCLLDKCPALVSDKQLSSLLSSAMLDILARRQVEAAIPASEILYCPFKECSALLKKPTSEMSTSAHPPPTCVACHRAFCADCMVPWHGDKSCSEFRADLKNESLEGDKMFLELAKKQKWQRCTKCGRVVDLLYGCNHIICLCRHEFCFICGVEMYGKVKKCTCPL